VRPNGSGQHRGLLGVAAVVVVGAVIVVAVVVFGGLASTSRTGATVTYAEHPPATTTSGYYPEPPTSTTTPYPTTTTTEPTDALSAKEELDRLTAMDRPAVEALVGQWVPQLSAKRPGLVVQGVTYDYVSILRDFRALQARYPDALLLYSGEYSSFRFGDFWITVVPLPQSTGEYANAWCDGQGIGPDDCYAKLLSHTSGYQESTLYR
jgi:serine/threonine-protein kinase